MILVDPFHRKICQLVCVLNVLFQTIEDLFTGFYFENINERTIMFD